MHYVLYTNACLYIYICIWICIYICTCEYIYIYIYKHIIYMAVSRFVLSTDNERVHLAKISERTVFWWRPVACVTQQTCLLYDKADMSAVWHSRHVCCVTKLTAVSHIIAHQTCLLCHTADMFAVSHSRFVCCVTQQKCLLRHTADMSAVWHSRHVCCVTQ